jgi:glycosyltransferase involved in cell wall biosynthesis
MKIMMVTAMFPPIRTGTAFYSLNLATHLAARGNSVTVVTTPGDAFSVPFVVDRLPALHFPLKNYFKHLRFTSCFPQNYLRMYALARRTRAEVILLVNHYLDIAFPAIFASRLCRIPLVCSVGTQLQSANPRRDRILNVLDKAICGTAVFPFCRRVIAWDTEILRYLSEIQGPAVTEKTSIVNFGVNGDPAVFLQHTHDYTRRGQLLGVGAVTEQRDFIPLVRAFQVIAREFPDQRLKIVGHVYNQAARELVRELRLDNRVTFTGELPHDQVLAEMRASDAYFVSLSGRYLGLGMATVESMLLGVPTIANVPSDLLGHAVLRDGEHIILTEGRQPLEVAHKIRHLLASQSLRERVGRGGRQFITDHMNWGTVAEQMENLLLSIASPQAAARLGARR